MLQRAVIHLSLILLFAFTQIGVVTHQVSHYSDAHSQQQQDQDNHENQCGQCISYSHMANADVAHATQFDISPIAYAFLTDYSVSVSYSQHYTYSARAPPAYSQT